MKTLVYDGMVVDRALHTALEAGFSRLGVSFCQFLPLLGSPGIVDPTDVGDMSEQVAALASAACEAVEMARDKDDVTYVHMGGTFCRLAAPDGSLSSENKFNLRTWANLICRYVGRPKGKVVMYFDDEFGGGDPRDGACADYLTSQGYFTYVWEKVQAGVSVSNYYGPVPQRAAASPLGPSLISAFGNWDLPIWGGTSAQRKAGYIANFANFALARRPSEEVALYVSGDNDQPNGVLGWQLWHVLLFGRCRRVFAFCPQSQKPSDPFNPNLTYSARLQRQTDLLRNPDGSARSQAAWGAFDYLRQAGAFISDPSLQSSWLANNAFSGRLNDTPGLWQGIDATSLAAAGSVFYGGVSINLSTP